MKICCPEEIALRLGYVSRSGMEAWLSRIGKSEYGEYVVQAARSLGND